MDSADNEQLKRIESDLDAIKSVLKKNVPLFRMLVAPDHFRTFSLLMGVMFLLLPGIYYFFMTQYGGYYQIPDNIRIILLFVVAFSWVIAGILKNVLWYRSIDKELYPMSWFSALKAFMSGRILHIYIPILFISIVMVFYLLETGNTYYIIPACAIGAGVIYNVLGTLSEVWQYLVTGYWLTLSGTILLFNPISAPIAIIATFSVGFALFYVFSIRKGSTRGRTE